MASGLAQSPPGGSASRHVGHPKWTSLGGALSERVLWEGRSNFIKTSGNCAFLNISLGFGLGRRACLRVWCVCM